MFAQSLLAAGSWHVINGSANLVPSAPPPPPQSHSSIHRQRREPTPLSSWVTRQHQRPSRRKQPRQQQLVDACLCAPQCLVVGMQLATIGSAKLARNARTPRRFRQQPPCSVCSRSVKHYLEVGGTLARNGFVTVVPSARTQPHQSDPQFPLRRRQTLRSAT